MNLRRGKLPFSLYSFRAGFTLSFGFVTIWSLKRSTTKAMASTPPRRSYRVCSVIVYSSLSFLGRIRSAHGPILLIRAVRTTGSSARESLIYHATLRLRLHYCGAWPFPSSCPYSPKYLEVKFSEVHCSKLNRPGRGLGTWTGAERRFARNRAHARHDRGKESLQAVATCYAHDFRESLRRGKPRRRAVKPTSQPTNARRALKKNAVEKPRGRAVYIG